MPTLTDRLMEVDLGGGRLSGGDVGCLNRCIVRDVPMNTDGVRVIFLLESPHRDEIRCGYPLAGRSGRRMTSDLVCGHQLAQVDAGTPLGRLVRDNQINWLAVMNVSCLPLQKEAYRDVETRSAAVRTLWCAFEEIRGKAMEAPDGRELDLCPIACNVYKVILEDLACRIGQIRGRQPKIFPFGKVARASLSEARRISPSVRDLPASDIPVRHPAAWHRGRYDDREGHLRALANDVKAYLRT